MPDPESDRDFVARAARRAIVVAVVVALSFASFFVMKGALTPPLAAAFVIAYLGVVYRHLPLFDDTAPVEPEPPA